MLAIIADDLTGALDSAAPFAGRGLRTKVILALDAIAKSLSASPDVLAICLGSRELNADEARHRARIALSQLPAGTRLFKKIDSRLKGNIAAELDAISFQRALVAPAIPAFGRIVTGGRIEGFGVDTPIPVHTRLGAHAQRCSIPDTPSREAMQLVLAAALADGTDLLIGARGLAEALAVEMTGRADAVTAEIAPGPGLFVIGSRDPITLQQIERLTASTQIDLRQAPNGTLRDCEPSASPLCLVQAVPGPTDCASDIVGRQLARSVVPALAGSASTLLLSGGATAEAVLDAIGIDSMRLMGECMPGLGLALVEGHCIIAKSGGFGGPDTLKDIATTILRKMR